MSNPVSGATLTPTSTTPWEKATLAFISESVFSGEERKLLETSSLESLQGDIVKWDQVHLQRSKMRKLGNRLKPMISGLEVFGNALDVLSQVEPKGILAAVWGSIRVLLVLGRRFTEAFEDIMEQMARLGPSLQRLEIISAVHKDKERLDRAVFQVFQRYLGCVMTIRMILKTEKPNDLLQRLKEKFRKAGKLVTYQESFAESLHEVEESCLNAEAEAGLADSQAAAEFYTQQKQSLEHAIDSLKGLKMDQMDFARDARGFYESQKEQYEEMIAFVRNVHHYQETSKATVKHLATNYENIAATLAAFQRDKGTFEEGFALRFYAEIRSRSQNTIDTLTDRLEYLFSQQSVHANSLEGRLQSIEDENRRFQEKQQRQWEKEERGKLRNQQKEIEKWLSPFNFQAIQEDNFDKSYPTGDWFTEHPVFEHWTEGKRWQIRLYGEAGVGKTMLSSIVVQFLQQKFSPKERPVLCVYMNHGKAKTHTPEHLLGSLLRQLVALKDPKDPLILELSEHYKQAQKNGTKPRIRQITEILRNAIAMHTRVYIIIDALDECSLKYRFSLLRDIQSLGSNRLSLLITERPTVPVDARGVICNGCQQPDQKEYYHCDKCKNGRWDVCLECWAKGLRCQDSRHSLIQPYDVTGGRIEFNITIPLDVLEKYVTEELAKEFGVGGIETKAWDPRFPHASPDTTTFARNTRRDPGLLERIPSIIARRADGRFLFAKLYWESVKMQMSLADIQETLENLPEELGQLYLQTVERIRERNDLRGKKIAFKVLSQVFFAQRSLSLAELQHMLATRDGDKGYDMARYVDGEDILQSTAGLITIDADKTTVTLSHQTVHEYFQSESPIEFREAQADMAIICLTILDYAFPTSRGLDEKANEEWPLAAYASQHWGDHVQAACYDERIEEDIRQRIGEKALVVLNSSTRVETLVRVAWQTDAHNFNSWDAWRHIHTLHVSAWFGLDFAVYRLIENGAKVDVTEPTFQQTPLIYACRRGKYDVVRRLITNGADPNRFSARGSSSLFEAIEHNQPVVFGDLLDFSTPERPIQVNLRHPREFDRTPLMVAIHRGHSHLVYKLLSHPGVDVNARDRDGQTALMIAARKGLDDVAEVLFDVKELEVDTADFKVRRTALICAAEYGHAAFVRLLLDRGAGLNFGDRLGGTALMRATDKARKSVIEVMVQNLGVDKQCRDLDGRGLLHAACANGNTDVIEMMAKLNLDVNLQDCNGMTPLHEAARCGQSNAAEMLLSWGAKTELEDEVGRTAYIIAWQYGHHEIMRLLEAKNTSDSINPPSGPDTNLPSWALVRHSRIDSLKALIEQGDLSLCDTEPNTGNTVLHIAILTSQTLILQLLLQSLTRVSLSIDSINRHLRTPLHLAVITSSLPAVSLLLSHNASLTSSDIWSATPLSIAISDHHNPIALRLIEADAPLDPSRHSDIQRLFFKAVKAGSVKAAEALLHRGGADKNGRTLDDGLTACQIAKKMDDVEMQRFLKVAKTFTIEEMGQGERHVAVKRRETGMKEGVGLEKIHE